MAQKIHINDNLHSELIIVGAQHEELIFDKLDRLEEYLKVLPDTKLRDVAYTMAVHSVDLPHKIAIVATSIADLLDKIIIARRRLTAGNRRNAFSKGVYVGTPICPAPGRTVFLFPGEGSQYPDMLRDLTLHFPACRAAFDAADTAVASSAFFGSGSGMPLLPSKWIYPTDDYTGGWRKENISAPLAIEAVMAADSALLFLFQQLGISPDAVMGVGVGEIIALECAGAITLKDKLSRIRMLGDGYRLIAEIDNDTITKRSAIYSVSGLTKEEIEGLLSQFKDHSFITGYQAAELFTVAIDPQIEKDITAKITASGGFFRKVPSISKPFHTPLMKPYLQRFEGFYRRFVNGAPTVPVYSCTSENNPATTIEDLVRNGSNQWLRAVNVGKTIERLYDDGFRVFVELGARGILSTAVSSTLRHKPHLALAVNRGHRPDMLQFHHTLAALVSHGAYVDLMQLHIGRNSVLLDLDHPTPGQEVRTKKISLPHSLPVISDFDLSPNLIAKTLTLNKPLQIQSVDDDSGCSDFPCLNFGEIVRFSPQENIELSLRFNSVEFPYLLNRSLSAGSTSAYQKNARGLVHAPLELLLEVMAEAARKLFPGKVVIEISNVESELLYNINKNGFSLRIQGRKLPKNATGKESVELFVFDEESFHEGTPKSIASAIITLGDKYLTSPETSTLVLKSPIRLDWHADDLYPTRLYSGEAARAIKSIPELGENGLTAECIMPPRSGIVRSHTMPKFSVHPTILASFSDALSALYSREAASGSLQVFLSIEKLEFFVPQLQNWTEFKINLSSVSKPSADKLATATVEAVNPKNNTLILKATNLRNRIIHIPRDFHALLLNPLQEFFACEVPKSSLPVLSHEVICCQISKNHFNDNDAELRNRIAAEFALSNDELEKWNDLNVSLSRRNEWLYGRIAAKDAVRKCLLLRYGRKIGARDVLIESDEAGKPSPQGPWRKACGAQMDISISHTPEFIAAAAAPNASLGIDIEKANRLISEEFATSAFSELEQGIAAESGDGAIALLRFWCAKEALSKALGTGLRYGPGDLSARSIDKTSGKVEMEATKLWLNPFPHLRGMKLPVQTCILGDVVLAISVLNPSLTKSETGPFIRWN